MEELRLHHLPRHEKKRLVKGWHATHAPLNVTPSRQSSDSLRSLFAAPPGALACESQRSGTWRCTPDATNGSPEDYNQQEETLPKTVSQVQHAYRVRARKQEARDASNALRKRERFLELRRSPRWRERGREAKTEGSVQEPTILQEEAGDKDSEHEEAVKNSQDEEDAELQLVNLPVDQVVTDAAYRDAVLRQIRGQLAKGGHVFLQSDCAASKESVSSTRLMLQTLCTQSLAYCVRDQSVVPETLDQQQPSTRLALRLLPRHQPSSVTPSPCTNTTW
jgi:hypothetical protein